MGCLALYVSFKRCAATGETLNLQREQSLELEGVPVALGGSGAGSAYRGFL